MSKPSIMYLNRSSRSSSFPLASLLPSSSSFSLLLNSRVNDYQKRDPDQASSSTSKVLLPSTNYLSNVFARPPPRTETCSTVDPDLRLNSILEQVEKKQDNSFKSLMISKILPVRTGDSLNIKSNQSQRRSLQQNISNDNTVSNRNILQKKNASSHYHKQLVMPSFATIVCICLMCAFPSLSTVNAKAKRCISCNLRSFEEYKQIRQEQILTDLLKKLELSAKPNVTVDYDNLPPIGRQNPRIKALIEQSLRENHRRVRKSTRSVLSMIPERVENDIGPDLYVSDEPKDYFPSLYETDAYETPEISYVVAELPPVWFNRESKVAYFKFPQQLTHKYVNKATLTLFVRQPDNYRFVRLPIRVDVYERFPNGTLGDKIATKHEQLISDNGYGFMTQVQVHLDEMDVQHWLRGTYSAEVDNNSILPPNEEIEAPYVALYIQAIYDNENIVVYPKATPTGGLSNGMFMELEVLDSGRSRQRRTTQPMVCRPGSNETRCCLYDLMIDFEKVGWDFVIAPKRYNAYICNGECTYSQISQTPRGSIAQRAHLDYLQCCHPKEYSSITIVYVTDSNQIWVKEVPGMVARRCGCA